MYDFENGPEPVSKRAFSHLMANRYMTGAGVFECRPGVFEYSIRRIRIFEKTKKSIRIRWNSL
jgi:hypothetical protein